MKAVAAVQLTAEITPAGLAASGVMMGLVLLVLGLTGWITWIARVVPQSALAGLSTRVRSGACACEPRSDGHGAPNRNGDVWPSAGTAVCTALPISNKTIPLSGSRVRRHVADRKTVFQKAAPEIVPEPHPSGLRLREPSFGAKQSAAHGTCAAVSEAQLWPRFSRNLAVPRGVLECLGMS